MQAYPTKDAVAESEAADSAARASQPACPGRPACDDAADGVASGRPAGALIVAVDPESPADDAGFAPGCRIVSVDGSPVRDLIDWRWLSSDDAMAVGYIDLDGDRGEVELEREEGEGWGFSFDGAVFDGVRQCRNACTFCFMRQLPRGMRRSLYLRDDDFRLSFLSGTFVTLTNLAPEDERRIVQQRISPLRVSLHAADPEVRRALMGRHAQAGIEALDRLLAAGIEAHTQIVLVPGVNDGDVLRETLEWARQRPGILDVGIVPLGYTRHQRVFDRSFNNPVDARAVLDLIAPFQEAERARRGTPWVFAADEFYRNAYGTAVLDHVPPAADYGDFSMFEDGIGIIRSCADDWRAACASGAAERCAQALDGAGRRALYVAGFALRETFPALVAESPLRGSFEPLFVENRYFGGNVDVTGLLAGEDVARAIRERLQEAPGGRAAQAGAERRARDVRPEARPLVLLPRVMFNDDGVTLDDWTAGDIADAAGIPVSVVSCNPSEYLKETADLAHA